LGKVISDQNNEISIKLKQGEIVIINSYTDLECSINRDLLEEYPGSWLIVPLVVVSIVWGVISLDCHHRHRHWLDMEVDLAINISTQLAIAIQQSNFYHQLEQEVSQRQKTKNLLEL
jgi:GAF domain-containing protein